MPENGEPLARFAGVGHRYGREVALDDITIELPPGRMLGLVGPDGVGKSTVLGLLAGVRRLQTGELRVMGGDLARADHRRRICEKIAYMPQGLGRNLYPTLSVFENIDFFGRLFGQNARERAARIDELLGSIGLEGFADRPAGKLSGGMKQKLGLCCALVHDPDLLILDEPTTGVDPLARRRFWELITRLRERREGMSIVIATAYMEEAEHLDWLVAIDEGKVLATGTPDELREETGTETLEDAFITLGDGDAGKREKLEIPKREKHDAEPVIEAKNLTKRFGDFTAVDAVSFEIEKGEIFGFLGSNGCGKTTTMKMLTGLVPASDGEAEVLGQPIDAEGIETRRRVGYMSQNFSLYRELSVRQNLALHARLFHLPKDRRGPRVDELLERFDLGRVADQLPQSLPVGVRQRLSLAVAVIHEPEMLILDEPTSGVDPAVRDSFWALLGQLSRDDGVTIFISTHFMNEAERCDRISLMHEGRVLAIDTPEALRREKNAETLEDAFVQYLEEASDEAPVEVPETNEAAGAADDRPALVRSLRRGWAYARREAVELWRDPIRIAFAILGPVVLMIAFGFGISFDVEDLAYAVLDRDQSPESRRYLEEFEGSRYFLGRTPLSSEREILPRLQSGELELILELQPGFGRDLLAGRTPEIAVWLDGAMPFRAERKRDFVEAVTRDYLGDLALTSNTLPGEPPLVRVEPRFRYNQSFESAVAVTPGVIMLLLVIVPAMLTALGVVREKELGSIANLYATPTTRLEYLIGKQLPYVAVGFVAFLILVLMTIFLFRVPLQGSFAALALGALIYLFATTALGLFISSFVQSQVAALFGTAIITTIPAVNFSGLLTPVSSLDGISWWFAMVFPAAWFQTISVGVFAKGLGVADLGRDYAVLALMAVALTVLAATLTPEQEK